LILKAVQVLDGFPSAGLANAIASKCFIHSLKTELVAGSDSPSFPALSVINDSEPNFPVRIYANENLKLGIFGSELNFDQSMYKPLAKIILNGQLRMSVNSSFLLQERLYSRLKKRTRRSWILLYMPLEAQKRLQEDFKMPESNSFPMDLSLEFRRYY
jgi:predicted ATP-grasp superfamily ATP-dependent carboligase